MRHKPFFVRLSLLVFLGAMASAGCEKNTVVRAVAVGPSYPADEDMPLPRPGSPVPQPILSIEWRSSEAYCLARDGRWSAVPPRLAGIRAAMRDLPMLRENVSLRVAELGRAVRNIEDAARVEDRLGAMLYANQVYRVAVEMSTTFNPETPADLAMLVFHVRELEIWCGMGDAAKLRQAGAQMLREWNMMEAYMRSSGNTRQADRMATLSRQLKNARSADDYSRLVRPMRQELRELRAAVVPKPTANPAFDFD